MHASFDKPEISTLMLDSFKVVTDCAHPGHCIGAFIPAPPNGRLIVIGAGKASAAMAAAFEQRYAQKYPDQSLEGLVVTRYGHSVATKVIKIVEAAHPVPDEVGENAVSEILSLLSEAGPADLIVCLLSGGGSSLLSAPVDGVSFAEIQALNKALLASGAEIAEINIVRKHLNRALGGGLAQAAPRTKMVTLAISDVTGDDPATIASGPTVADPSTLSQARDVFSKYGIEIPAPVKAALENPVNETPKPDDFIFENKDYHLIATPKSALEAVAGYWQGKGFEPYILDAEMVGDTNECAAVHVKAIKDIMDGNGPVKRPCALISGGETTVKIAGSGQGGPNTQFMLQAAILLDGAVNIYGMACDTDGIDGNADQAGAMITPDILQRAEARNLDAGKYLADNDSYNFFDPLDALVKTGPTYTNVNDYRVFLLLL